jgi:hypothetical protein
MSNSKSLVALIVLLIAGAVYLANLTDGEHETPVDGGLLVTEVVQQPVDLEEPVLTPAELSSATEVLREEVLEASEESTEETIEGPSCRLLGRVEDDHGAPVADARIYLYTVGEVWSEEVEDPRPEVQTAADGSFELVMPLPTSDWISLSLQPGPFLSRESRDFGPAGGRDRPRLVEGDNDLGTFYLQASGVIAGFVRTADGQTFERGRASIDGSFPGGMVLGTWVDSAGRYEIKHVPPGNHDIKVLVDGYQIGRSLGIDVRAGVMTDGMDLVLEPASQISGRVRDQAGVAIEGARVGGYPLRSGRGASKKTDAEGRFTLYLPQDEPYRITVKKAGYLTWGEEGRKRGVEIEPGTVDLEVVLIKFIETTFAVVDAASGLPIERFGLGVHKSKSRSLGSSSAQDEELMDVPGGEQTLPADPLLHEVRIQAPGHAPLRLRVKHDEEGTPRQTVALEKEGRIRGRVVFEGKGVAGARLRLDRCLFMKSGAPRPAEIDIFGGDATYDLDDFSGRTRWFESDEAGAFELDELATGTYRVEIKAGVGTVLVVEDLRVTAGAVLDAGDLILELGGTVHCRVVLSGGATGAGLKVYLDKLYTGQEVVVGNSGEFEFTRVRAGEHELHVSSHEGLVARSKPFPFQVEAGGTTQLDLDLRPYQVGGLRFRVTRAGVPQVGLKVSLLSAEGSWRHSRKTTNDRGEVLQEALAGQPIVRVKVGEPSGLSLGSTLGPWTPVVGSEIEIDLQIETADLTLVFPADFELPERGSARLILAAAEGSENGRLSWSTETTNLRRSSFLPWGGHELALGPVAAGEHAAKVSVYRYRTNESGRRELLGEEQWAATVSLAAGAVERVVLERVQAD